MSFNKAVSAVWGKDHPQEGALGNLWKIQVLGSTPDLLTSLRAEPGICILTPTTPDNCYVHQSWRTSMGFNDILRAQGWSECGIVFSELHVSGYCLMSALSIKLLGREDRGQWVHSMSPGPSSGPGHSIPTGSETWGSGLFIFPLARLAGKPDA